MIAGDDATPEMLQFFSMKIGGRLHQPGK